MGRLSFLSIMDYVIGHDRNQLAFNFHDIWVIQGYGKGERQL
jgi:hypothetical protein